MDLTARPARSGIAHLPEIVFQPEFVDALLGYVLVIVPQIVGFLVAWNSGLALEDRDKQLVFRDAEPLRRSDQLPCEADRVFLEVVAERKVPEHLEERMVTIGKADVLEVVMLAARTNALLRRGRSPVIALLQTKKNVLELVHSGVSEEQCGIVRRNERRRMDFFMSILNKKVEELAAYLGASQHEDCSMMKPSF